MTVCNQNRVHCGQLEAFIKDTERQLEAKHPGLEENLVALEEELEKLVSAKKWNECNQQSTSHILEETEEFENGIYIGKTFKKDF